MRLLWAMLKEHRDLGRLLAAGLISVTGDWMLGIGLGYYVYQLTGSTLASAGIMLASWVPSVVFGSLAGVFVDRWDRKVTMIVGNLLLAAGLLPLALVTHPSDVWIIYVVAVFGAVVEQFANPAEKAMVPLIVEERDLPTANALNGQSREVGRLVGSAVGGIVVASGGITALAIADAATFVAAAVLVAGVATRGRAVAEGEAGAGPDSGPTAVTVEDPVPGTTLANVALDSRRGFRRLLHEWSEGLKVVAVEPALRVVFLYTLLAMTGEGLMGTLFAPFVRDVLHGSARAYGVIAGVQAIGGLVGGVVAASLGQRASPAAMFGVGAVLFGSIDLTMFLYPLAYDALWPAAVCMVVVGLPGAVLMVGYNTLLQTHTTDVYRGRVFGALGIPQGIGILGGALAAGLLGGSVGIVAVLAWDGVLAITGGLIILVVLRHQLRSRPLVVS